MDPFVPISDDIPMNKARHLRVVEAERTYVVARTKLVVPGRPYVVAECAAGALASAPPGLEMIGRSIMLGDPSLRNALTAWESQDEDLMRRDETARSRLRRSLPGGRTAEEARAAHPSSLAKRWHMPRPATRPGD